MSKLVGRLKRPPVWLEKRVYEWEMVEEGGRVRPSEGVPRPRSP